MGATIQLLGGRGLESLNWKIYLFHLLSAIFYLFHTLPQSKYLFHFPRIYFSCLRLVLIWRLLRRAKAGLTHFKCHLMMRIEARQKFEGHLIFIYKCPSDNYLFHEISVSKYSFQEYSTTPGDEMVVPKLDGPLISYVV